MQGRTGIRSFSLPHGTKKMSGRWGDRPLGRGDGGNCNLKPARLSFHAAKLAISSTTYRSDQATTSLRNPAQLLTTFAILLPAPTPVDSPPVSFRPVLTPHNLVLRPGTFVLPPSFVRSLGIIQTWRAPQRGTSLINCMVFPYESRKAAIHRSYVGIGAITRGGAQAARGIAGASSLSTPQKRTAAAR
jgi:hypothetical protein